MNIEIPQTQLAMAIAAAVLSGAVLSAAAGQSSSARERALQDAADELAMAIGLAHCSGASISLLQWEQHLPAGVLSVLLLKDHVRISAGAGASKSSIEFPPLANGEPLELFGHSALRLARDALSLACRAAVLDG